MALTTNSSVKCSTCSHLFKEHTSIIATHTPKVIQVYPPSYTCSCSPKPNLRAGSRLLTDSCSTWTKVTENSPQLVRAPRQMPGRWLSVIRPSRVGSDELR